MIACFTSLPQPALQRLRDDPDGIEEFLYPDTDDEEPPNYIDLDKAWHGLHYLLTDGADDGPLPLSLSILGGTEFGSEMGYGPARFLMAEQVAAVAAALALMTSDELSQRFNPQEMEARQIYPDVIWVRDGDEALQFVIDAFAQLQTFYVDAAARGDAVIQWLA